MSRINIIGQFDRHNLHTAFSNDKVIIIREDGLEVEYIKKNDFALSNWYKFCDEIDESLQEIYVAKRKVKRYGLLPILVLFGDLIFVIVYSFVSSSRFLLYANVASISAFIVSIISALSLLVFDYRIRLRCTEAWQEVREICRRYSSNVVQYRLKNEKFNKRGYWSAKKFFIVVYLPGDRGFVTDRSNSRMLETIEEGRREITPASGKDYSDIILSNKNDDENYEFKDGLYLDDYFETNPKSRYKMKPPRVLHAVDSSGHVIVDSFGNDEEEGTKQNQMELSSRLNPPSIAQSEDTKDIVTIEEPKPLTSSTIIIKPIENERQDVSISWAALGKTLIS
jgi:hypothetical protein